MNKSIMALVALSLIGCSQAQDSGVTEFADVSDCTATVPASDISEDQILVIGDSISLGYTPILQHDISTANIIHNPCNGQSTRNALDKIDSWLAIRPHWKLITFNHGMWDIVPGYNIPIDLYKSNLRIEALKIIASQPDKIIFFTSTIVPAGADNRNNDDIEAYNSAAVAVMGELGIEVFDLYTVSAGIPLADHLTPTDVHYTQAGYGLLAEAIELDIQNYL